MFGESRQGVLEEDDPIPKSKKYIFEFEGKSKLFYNILIKIYFIYLSQKTGIYGLFEMGDKHVIP